MSATIDSSANLAERTTTGNVVAAAAPHTAGITSTTSRLGGVDWLRLIAIVGVVYYHAADVWYHDAPLAWLGFAGLHALTAAACYFACTSRSAASNGQIIWKRFNRLMIPWFIFSLPHLLSAIKNGKFQPWMIWMGGAMHLWFLPFIFVVGCAIAIARRHGLIVRGTASAIAWTTAALAAAVMEPFLSLSLPETPGAWQAINAMPSALLGIAIFTLPEQATIRSELLQLLSIAAIAVLLGIVGPESTRSWPPVVAVGALLFGIARLLPIAATAVSDFVGRSSFGVYLMHMLALLVIVKLSERLSLASQDAHVLAVFGQVGIAVIACMVAVAILERTPLRRFIS